MARHCLNNPLDPLAKIFTVHPSTLAPWYGWQYTVQWPVRHHEVLVLEWAEQPGWVNIAILMNSKPAGYNPNDFFSVVPWVPQHSGTRLGFNEVTIRRNRSERFMHGKHIYLGREWIFTVPLCILSQYPQSGLQLMLQKESFEKVLHYLHNNNNQTTVPTQSAITFHYFPAYYYWPALNAVTERGSPATFAMHPYTEKELSEHTRPEPFPQYLGYYLQTP